MQKVKTVTKRKRSLGERLKVEWSNNKGLYLMSILIVGYFLLFKYMPMFGLTIAFKDFRIAKGVFGSEWVGVRYFIEFFNSIYFTRTLFNTLILSGLSIVFSFPVPIIFALLLNEVKNKKFKTIVQTSSYLPHFISMVVFCGMITDFFSTDGLLTKLITYFGGENMNYIGDKRYFRAIFVGSGVWQTFGWGSIIYLAALSGIDEQLYEAAAIDGAGRWKQTIHVTLPGIANTIIVMLILRMGQVLSVGYEKIILLYSAPTYEVADVISSYTYRMGILDGRYSYSAAVGLFQSVVNVIIVLTANGLSRKYSEMSLF